MHVELIKKKLFEQSDVYQALKNGDASLVQYREYKDKQWGTQDANYKNRMRLAYYLLYANIDDESTVEYLFKEELKDRKTNSFQGIGSTLNVLTSVLSRYYVDGKYDVILEEAKNANFDCACGYDRNYQIDSDIDNLDLMDCIFLAQDLDYKDVMGVLVDRWKESITEWTDGNKTTLIRFNSFLDREKENELIYKELLAKAVVSDKNFNIVSAYNKVIRYYIDIGQFEIAHSYLQQMLYTTDFKDIERIRLFGDVLEECFEIICGGVKESGKLWEWAKPYLQRRSNMYGNLYTKGIAAAKTVSDSYAVQLEREYADWKKKVGLK